MYVFFIGINKFSKKSYSIRKKSLKKSYSIRKKDHLKKLIFFLRINKTKIILLRNKINENKLS